MLDVLGQDFLRTAQAKGLTRTRALIKHGLRTALIPIATFFSYNLALLFIGSTFVENIFSWHGMGEYLVTSITTQDINSIAATTLFVAVLVLMAGFLSDIAYAALDPRVRVVLRRKGARMTTPSEPVLLAEEENTAADMTSVSRGRLVLRRFFRRKMAVLGLLVVLLLVFLAFVGPHLTQWSTPSSTSTTSIRRRRARTGSAPTRSASTCSR